MKVHELMEILARANPEATVVIRSAHQGLVEVTTAHHDRLGGVEHRMSWDEIPVLELTNGQGDHMKEAHGMDVVGYIPVKQEPRPPLPGSAEESTDARKAMRHVDDLFWAGKFDEANEILKGCQPRPNKVHVHKALCLLTVAWHAQDKVPEYLALYERLHAVLPPERRDSILQGLEPKPDIEKT